MNLQIAMTLNEPRAAALAYYDAGLSVIPCTGKKALVGWQRYQTVRASRVEIARWYPHGGQKNIGVVLGKVSGGIVVIDLDGEKAVGLFRSQWPAMMKTLTVFTGSGKGLHLYFKVIDVPQTTRYTSPGIGNIEVRSNGAYVIAPPSIHPETSKKYLPGLLSAPMELYSLAPVTDWLLELGIKRHALKQPTEIRPTIKGVSTLTDAKGNPVRNKEAYGRASLQSEINRLIKTPEGNRNVRLNEAAFRLAQLIPHGALSESDIERQLFIACLGWADMKPSEITNTIKSGIKAGKEKPNDR